MTGAKSGTLGNRLWSSPAIVIVLVAIKLLIHLLTAANYGLFVDELYFLAWLARALFGTSVFGIHVLPALAGAGLVSLAALIVREWGGGRFAQVPAGLGIIVASVFLTVHSYLSMNAVEPRRASDLLLLGAA